MNKPQVYNILSTVTFVLLFICSALMWGHSSELDTEHLHAFSFTYAWRGLVNLLLFGFFAGIIAKNGINELRYGMFFVSMFWIIHNLLVVFVELLDVKDYDDLNQELITAIQVFCWICIVCVTVVFSFTLRFREDLKDDTPTTTSTV